MHASAGILTSRGGMTSHAAVVARGMGKPCIVGAGDLEVDEHAGEVRVDGKVFHEGDELSIDGTSGEVLAGALADPPLRGAARAARRRALFAGLQGVPRSSSNGPTPSAACASAPTPTLRTTPPWPRALGAQGIGLCRTEHMFFDDERIPWVRQMILANDDDTERATALAKLLPMQQKDFEGIFAALNGLPITVRLLDPPLHEFLPHGEKALRVLAEQMGIDAADVKARAEVLAEANPMLGLRGCRLGTHRARRSTRCRSRPSCAPPASASGPGDDVRPEIMSPWSAPSRR